ncbi:hypothetical protein ACFYO0_38005 [Streptomyces sp. NPDC006365]|uniref:hypothetical protein n=1 Tax=Streptomyces sp. NPDC006365 TaxID=3364744 RepID=UPI0036D0180F
MARNRHARPPSDTRVFRLTLWHRAWGLCAALLGAAVIVAAILILSFVPELMGDVRAYRAAEPCPAGASPGDNCIRTFPATVRGTVIRESAKSPEYTLKLTGSRPVPSELSMDDSAPLLKHLRRGDEVTVTVWRDRATTVGRDGVTQESLETPVGEPEYFTAGALALLPVGAYGSYAGTVALRRARTHARRGRLPASLSVLGKVAGLAALAALPAFLFGDLIGGALWVVAVWLLLLPLVGLFVRHQEREKQERENQEREKQERENHDRQNPAPVPAVTEGTASWMRYLMGRP